MEGETWLSVPRFATSSHAMGVDHWWDVDSRRRDRRTLLDVARWRGYDVGAAWGRPGGELRREAGAGGRRV